MYIHITLACAPALILHLGSTLIPYRTINISFCTMNVHKLVNSVNVFLLNYLEGEFFL